MSIRKPAVAGSFYPSDRAELGELVDDCYLHPLGPGRLPPGEPSSESVLACVVPHAALFYSGPVAAHSYLHLSSLRNPDLVVIVAPNHYGVGSGVSSYDGGGWQTPLGTLKVDGDSARALSKVSGIVDFDPTAHRMEHSLEVQLPFIQRLYGDRVPFVPISLIFQDPETTKEVSRGIQAIVKGKRVLLIASSDFSHYIPAADARRRDMALIEDIISLDVGSFYSTLERLDINACGPGAIATVMQTVKGLGFAKAELLKYANSGDTTGDNNQVVGYGALRFILK